MMGTYTLVADRDRCPPTLPSLMSLVVVFGLKGIVDPFLLLPQGDDCPIPDTAICGHSKQLHLKKDEPE